MSDWFGVPEVREEEEGLLVLQVSVSQTCATYLDELAAMDIVYQLQPAQVADVSLR